MKNDHYFKFLVVTILAGVVLVLVYPGHTEAPHPATKAIAASHR
jgi:hypothetical protein